MDAIAALIADHNRVRGLFKRFEEAREAQQTPVMSNLARAIFDELDVHTKIEEAIFYPWARGCSEEVAETVDEGLQEHHVVKMLMDEARSLDPGSSEWEAKVGVIIENVEHHAREEEEEQFPKVRSASDAERRRELGEELETRKAALGAPTLADKIDLTTTKLRKLAQAQAIPGRSSMNHEELAATVAPETV